MNISAKNLSSIHIFIGSRLRLLRLSQKISQKDLARALGVSFELVQKYEHGVCRFETEHLCFAAKFLNKPISFFFDGYDGRLVKRWDHCRQAGNIIYAFEPY